MGANAAHLVANYTDAQVRVIQQKANAESQSFIASCALGEAINRPSAPVLNHTG